MGNVAMEVFVLWD